MRHPIFLSLCLVGTVALTACDKTGQNKVDRAMAGVNAVDDANLSDIMLTVADPGEAVTYFQRTLGEHPDRIDLRRGLASSLIRAKRNDEAVPAWESVVSHPQATAEDRVELADALIRSGNWKRADAELGRHL